MHMNGKYQNLKTKLVLLKTLLKHPPPKTQQSTTDFLNMAFTSPKRDIVEMMTPQKEPITTALTPYRENRSLLDFAIGGTPQKTAQQIKAEKDIKRIKEIKHSTKPKHIFEYNTTT